MKHGIFIAEDMASTDVNSLLRSAISTKDMENGAVINLAKMASGELDLYEAGVATDKGEVCLVDGVELQADESVTRGLEDYINPAGKPFRVRIPLKGDRFSISASSIEGAAVAGDILEANAGNKLIKVEEATPGATSFKVVSEWVFGSRMVPMVRLSVL